MINSDSSRYFLEILHLCRYVTVHTWKVLIRETTKKGSMVSDLARHAWFRSGDHMRKKGERESTESVQHSIYRGCTQQWNVVTNSLQSVVWWFGYIAEPYSREHLFILHYEYYLQPRLQVEKEVGDRSLDWCSDGWLSTSAIFLHLDRQLLASEQSLCRPDCPACPWLQLLGKKPIRPSL
jgi:hypothetical protein